MTQLNTKAEIATNHYTAKRMVLFSDFACYCRERI
jgi:hypothetical protein